MEIDSDFVLPLEPGAAYTLLLDLDRVAPCMPGATLGEERDDGSRELSVTVRLGPMKFNYGGTVQVAERDDTARRAVLVGTAQEKRGQGSAKATITMTVGPDGDGASSRVASVAVFELTGRAAQTGRGIVEDVARRMIADMAACLAAKSAEEAPGASSVPSGAPSAPEDAAPRTPTPAAPAAAPPVGVGSLFLSILWQRIRRLWRGTR